MAAEIEPTSEQLNKLIDALVSACDLAGTGDQQAIETAFQCLHGLKSFKVNTHLLVETQGGKKIRKLTKHQDLNIKATASELVNIWKGVVASEAAAVEQSKQQLGGLQPADALAAPGGSQHSAELGQESEPAAKKRKLDVNGHSNEAEFPTIKEPVKRPVTIPQTGDASRDKIRTQLAEALQLASDVVPDGDPGARAADVESAVLRQNGAINPKYKAKIRSIWVNLKDVKNPDFRRAVLSGEITGEETVNLKPEEMASKVRQEENQKIREAAMFEAQRSRKRMATTDQFQCGKCRKRQCSYYQMQTRSADEPMTTFVICQVCDNRWKFC